MKYYVHTNQLVLHTEKKLDFNDAAVLEYIIMMCTSVNKKIVSMRKNNMTWIDYEYLLAELPMLRITSKSGVSKKIKKLEEAGFIETEKKEKYRLYVKITEKVDSLACTTGNARVSKSKRSVRVINNNINNKKKNNHNTKNPNSRVKALDTKQEEKFEFDVYIKEMSQHKSRHIQLIAKYFVKKEIKYDSKAKIQVAMKRHLRAATNLAPFSNKEIKQAVTICEEKYGDLDWTLETVVKVLTSNNLQIKDTTGKKYKTVKVS